MSHYDNGKKIQDVNINILLITFSHEALCTDRIVRLKLRLLTIDFMKFNVFFISLCLFASCNSYAAEKTIIRIGVQASGTVDWELATLQDNPQTDFQLEIQHVANAEAGKIALQSGAVDMIVSDWIWVSRLRATGSDFTFYPYSNTSGALVVPKNSPIHSVKDLKGKRLGIAGGELDKNWLLLQALAGQEQLDLNASVEKVFGAPPLINEQIKQNRVDAALTYWHFAARLEAQGYRQIIDGKGHFKRLRHSGRCPQPGLCVQAKLGKQP